MKQWVAKETELGKMQQRRSVLSTGVAPSDSPAPRMGERHLRLRVRVATATPLQQQRRATARHPVTMKEEPTRLERHPLRTMSVRV